jgi:hypothetical protein
LGQSDHPYRGSQPDTCSPISGSKLQ